jgi:CheY-like chemotaxis protein
MATKTAKEKKRTILVADDDQSIRLLLGELLAKAGYAVTVAPDGTAAIQHIRRKPFDLVMLDVHMPGMNGLEVLQKLKDLGRRAKVIIMTADNTPETLLEAVREQADRYVPKPFRTQALLELVSDTLEEQPPASPIEVVSARPHWVELVVPCERALADRIQGFMMALKADLPDDVRNAVGDAFREMLLNAIEWGGKLDPRRKVRISYLRAQRMLMYRIADPGVGFHFAGLEHAAISNPPEDPIRHMRVRDEKGLRAGGFGILMTQQKVDEVLYNEKQNEVVLIKYLD